MKIERKASRTQIVRHKERERQENIGIYIEKPI